MTTSYNQIAGRSVERLGALSDGVFAITMTLLILDLRVPTTEALHTERDLRRIVIAQSLYAFGALIAPRIRSRIKQR